ncbi:MAG: flagellar hook-length control protein FliK [Sedimentisphaerales bacterium]|nr:flagellar hook-length control protein FliK [Sedimentisphaerales bacterium]
MAVEAGEVTTDNTRIETGEPRGVKRSKDFGETLNERIQAEKPEKTTDTAESATEAPAEMLQVAKQPTTGTTGESQPASTEKSAAVTVESGKGATATANSTRQPGKAEIVTDAKDLLKGSEILQLPDLTVKAPGKAAAKASGQAAPKAVLAVGAAPPNAEHGQSDSRTVVRAVSGVGGEQIAKDGIIDSLGGVGAAASGGRETARVPTGRKTSEQSSSSDSANKVQQANVVEGTTRKTVAESLTDDTKPTVSDGEPTQIGGKAAPNGAQGFQENQLAAKGQSAGIQAGPEGSDIQMPTIASGQPDGQVKSARQSEAGLESPDGTGKEANLGEETLPGDSILQKVKAVQVQVSAGAANGNSTAKPDSGSTSEANQAVPATSHQTSVLEQAVNVSQTPGTGGSHSAPNTSASVSEQIQESIRGSVGGAERQITISLNPPELGKVVVRFQEQEDQLTGLLEVSKAQTRVEIQQVLPEITRNLQELGVHIRRLEVVMTSEPEHQAFNGQSATPQQGSWVSQHGAPYPHPDTPSASVNEFLTDSGSFTEFVGGSGTFVTDKSIDMFA